MNGTIKFFDKSNNNDLLYNKWIAKFIAFILCFDIISLGLNSLFNKYIAYGTVVDSLLLYAIAFYYIVRGAIASNKRIQSESVLFLIGLSIVILSNLLIHPNIEQYIKPTDYIYLATSAVVLIVSSLDYSIPYIYSLLSKIYKIAIIFGVIHLIYGAKSGIYTTWMSDMASGYSLLPAELFAIDYWFRFKKGWVWGAIGAITIFLFGSRGPLLLVFLFLLISLVRFSKSIRAKMLLISGLLAISGFVYSKAYIGLLISLQRFFSRYDITIASIEKVLYYEDVSNGRTGIYNEVIALINKHPLFGSGFFSDRSIGVYAHNLILEILVDFGYVIGIPIIVFIFYKISHALLCAKNIKDEGLFSFLLILILSSVGKLMISGSYLTDPIFFLLLSVIIQIKSEGKLQQ